jgi:predicted DsbA family dithiol-disulfide isomerase
VSLKPLEQSGTTIDWKAWRMPEDANPPAKPEGYMDDAKQFMKQLLERTGLTINPPSKKMNSYLAHIGGKFAKEKNKFQEYHLRIFQAVWEKGEDIEDVHVLMKIAEEIGLDSDEFKQGLGESKYKSSVDADFQQAIDEKIWTIPAYVGSKGAIQVHHFNDLPLIQELEKIL